MSGTLTVLIVLPLIGALGTYAAEKARPGTARWAALGTAVAELAVACVTIAPTVSESLLVEEFAQKGHGSWWSLALDGLSLPLVVLTAVLGVVAVLASWRVEKMPGAHHAMLLGLTAAIMGVFLASDLILFYVFWEAVLIPMFFLIGVWGHERRRHAAMKFFIYTFAGSALMLIGLILAITGMGTATGMVEMSGAGIPAARQTLIFWLLAAGFLVKIPAFPFHTWLPDAHVEAPTAGSIMLAGVLLKMGGYGLLRVALPIAPDVFGEFAWILAALGMIGILYGAFVAMAQSDLKRLVAYSSVAHMGFVVLAIGVATPAAVGAAMLGMVSHGLVSAMLFLLVGLLYERAHTREIARFGGLMRAVPAWGVAFSFGALASLGLPGLSGFPGEFLTFVEAFGPYGWWLIVPVVGVVVSAAYHLWAVRRVNHGAPPDEWTGMDDLSFRERMAVAPLAVGILVLGVWPGLVLGVTDRVAQIVSALVGGGV